MEFTKVSVILSCLILSIIFVANFTCAQNTPQDFLDSHNRACADVGVPPLTWNTTVAAYAQAYAIKRVKDCNLEHSNWPYGENIAEGSWDLTTKEAIDMWVGEKKNYDYNSNSCVGDQCEHYTQVVWINTWSVGCGRVLCQNEWTFITCNYYPRGNLMGDRPYTHY